MTESIQKKLLRVRPPRVRITYDVETGGAIEKKELPFIVGIFADLKGSRTDKEDTLKKRRITDIDRDNFNELMAALGPRVDFTGPNKVTLDWPGAVTCADDHHLIFDSFEAFEPLRIVRAMPALNSLYEARGQIRTLQAKSEADDDFAEQLDKLVSGANVNATARQIDQLASKPIVMEPDDQSPPGIFRKLLAVQATLDGDLAAALPNLKAFALVAGSPAPEDIEKEEVIAAIALGKTNARVLIKALAADNTAENRSMAAQLLTSWKPDAEPAATPANPLFARFDLADKNNLSAELKTAFAVDLSTLPDESPSWAFPLLVLGLSQADWKNDPACAATLRLAKFLSTPPDQHEPKLTAAQMDGTIADFFPMLHNDSANTILALQRFTDRLSLMVVNQLPKVDAEAARLDGAAALTDAEKEAASARALARAAYDEAEQILAVPRFKIAMAQKKGANAVIDVLVTDIDASLSKALSAIMHCPGFKQMEATWRGLHYLVFNTETSPMLRLRILDATKDELRLDMQKAVEFDQSTLFKKIYEDEYGTYGGLPYSLLIGDYAVGRDQKDIDFLKSMCGVAAAAHAPFIAQAAPQLFDLSGFESLGKPRDLKKIFEGTVWQPWRDFREMDDARYVSLVLPRALLRLPYGLPDRRNTIECEGLNFNEDVGPPDTAPTESKLEGATYPAPDSNNFLWGNPAFLLAERITNAFSLYNWTAAIRGVEGGGLVEGLPRYTYCSDSGATELLCPTEVSITDRREKELNDLGFISLCHCKGTSKAAFFGGQTTNQPKKYFSDDANANARISAMLPYMLAASRFAHYIKVIMREKVGSFLTRGNVESYLNIWIANYVLLDDNASQEIKSCYPLRSAKVVVTDIPGEPGAYRATVFLKPHFQLEELTTSIRLVAELPT
jgi:type VI secretion system protein ImpC